MFTQCPHCQTLFRIGQKQLEQAEGMARCCRCEDVFDAEKHLCGSPKPAEESRQHLRQPAFDKSIQTDEESTVDEQEELLASLEQEIENAPDVVPSPISSAELNVDDDATRKSEAEPVTSAAKELPDLESLLGQQSHKPRGPSLFWAFASLIALAALLLQLAWIERARLIEYPHGAKLLNVMCQQLGCKVPQLKNTSKIKILSRSISTHPDKAGLLQLHLTIVSDTAYDQPYPKLQLSLFNTDGALVASRTFSPKEYLPEEWQPLPTLMLAKREIDISLELADPGQEVTGFELEFL